MFKNFIKISIQNLFKHKLYSAINVLGLAVGLTCFLLIALFIRHELSFDRYHPHADRIYRLSMDFDNANRFWASNNYYLVPSIKESFPEIETAARIYGSTVPVRRGDVVFNETGYRLVDPEFFDLFEFQWLGGDPSQALDQLNSLVLTESSAKKYFGDEDPIGKTLLVGNDLERTVTGVIADLPDNTHLNGDFFVSMKTEIAASGEQAISGGFDFHSYVRVLPGVDIERLVDPISEMLRGLMPNFGAFASVAPIKLADIHLNPMPNEMPGTPGSMSIIFTFSVIAIGILLIACVNFMNLSTARSSQRAKEIGMRKSIGAQKSQLISQFLGESLFYSVIATIMAIVLVELLLPAFSTFVGKDISFDISSDPVLLSLLILLCLVMGLVAGSYPAFYLSRFEPSRVLKGDIGHGNAGLLFRNLLVIAQFSISIALIISTAVIFSQINYARNIELGYNKDQVVILNGNPTTNNLGPQWETMKQELLSHPDITQVTASLVVPGTDIPYGMGIWHVGGPQEGTDLNFVGVDFNYFETYQINLVSGRFFDESLSTDRMRFPNEEVSGASYILNETAARLLGWSADEAVGEIISWGAVNGVSGPVIGVVEDVFYESLRSPQRPIVYVVGRAQYSYLSFRTASIRISGNNISDTLGYIDDTWEKFVPGFPVSRSFLDQNFEIMYRAEDQQVSMLSYFSILAIFLACLGLYGLAAFNAERRKKEIGVRKVMGGSVWSIVVLLTNDFSKLVLISNLIAWPVAYYAMNQWLSNFAYRIDLTPMVFIGSGLIALCIAWVTVGGTAAKAASRKPVLALRYE